MFIKNASTKKYMRAIAAVLLYTILLSVFPHSLKSQEKPEFDKPFKVCRIYGNTNAEINIIASDNDKSIVIINEDNILRSINPETNLENWRSQTGGKILPKIISDKENIFYLSSFTDDLKVTNYTLNSISRKTGITNWQKKIRGFSKLNLYETPETNLLYLSGDEQNVLAFEKSDGSQKWIRTVTSKIISIKTLSDEQIGILTGESVIKLSIRSGELLNETRIRKNPVSNTIKNSSYILLGYTNGELIKISSNGKNGLLWKVKAGGGISSLIDFENDVLVSSLDNFLYLYSTASGKLKWKRRVSGRINIKPLVYEKFAIVVSSADNIASIIELDEGKIINQIEIEAGNYFSDEPIVLDKFIILPTFKGIYLFSNSDFTCK